MKLSHRDRWQVMALGAAHSFQIKSDSTVRFTKPQRLCRRGPALGIVIADVVDDTAPAIAVFKPQPELTWRRFGRRWIICVYPGRIRCVIKECEQRVRIDRDTGWHFQLDRNKFQTIAGVVASVILVEIEPVEPVGDAILVCVAEAAGY